MTPEVFWIPGPWSGKLAIANRPRGGDWLEDEARGLRNAGVEVVVSMLEPEEAVQLGLAEEAEAFQRSGLAFVSFPVPDRSVPEILPTAVLVAKLTAELDSGRSIAIHCRQSVGRAGLIACAALVASGMEPKQAIGTVSQARGETVPETTGQREWILSLPVGAPLSL